MVSLLLILISCEQKEIVTTKPVKKDIEEAVFASGYIEHENNYTISTKVEGIMTTLSVKEGSMVSQNDLIAIIENDLQNNQLQDALVVYDDAVKNASPNSPQLQSIQIQINQAKEQLAFDEENYKRYKALYEKKSIAQLEYEKVELQYENSKSNLIALEKNYKEAANNLKLSVDRSQVQVDKQNLLLKDYELRTKKSGLVINIFKQQGELLRKGETIAKIGNGDYIIKLFVSEDDITKVDIGNTVTVDLNTYVDQSYRATVTKIYPSFDKTEQSYIVEAKFEKMPEKMFSGTQLQADIKIGERKSVLVIPSGFVSKENTVMLENGEERIIKVGHSNGTWTEVVSGISEQDKIVKPNS